MVPLNAAALAADAVFLALPEAASAELAPTLLASGLRVIDLSGAFRLRDDAKRAKFYPATASLPKGVAYGLTEFELDAIKSARLLSNPGCYPTASLLGLLPLERAGLLKPGADIVIDAKSGISGRGQGGDRSHALFGEPRQRRRVQPVRPSSHAGDGAGARPGGDVRAAPGAARSRHPLEHVRAPRAGHDRGGGDARPSSAPTRMRRSCASTGDALPEIKHVAHTNFCDIGWKVDEATGRVFVVSVIDNLVKGAAGQAIQNFNVMFGFDQKAGLL